MVIPILVILLLAGTSASVQQRRAGTTKMSVASSSAEPQNLWDWNREADAIVHVRITGQTAFEVPKSTDGYWIYTRHEATVIEVFRGEPGITVGPKRAVVQFGGTILREDGPETVIANDWSPLPVASEWILFLEWNLKLKAFAIMYMDRGTLQIENGVISGSGRYPGWLRREWGGKKVEEFGSAVRRARRH
jgi:hypothetical protein